MVFIFFNAIRVVYTNTRTCPTRANNGTNVGKRYFRLERKRRRFVKKSRFNGNQKKNIFSFRILERNRSVRFVCVFAKFSTPHTTFTAKLRFCRIKIR